MLTSPSCSERDLLVKRFLETGAKKDEAAFYVTVNPGSAKALADEYPSSFWLLVCNPQADAIVKDAPNVVKIKGVENLTDISIALTSAIRKLDPSQRGEKRICLGLVSDVLLQHHAVQTRRWLAGLIPELQSQGFTVLAVMDPEMHPLQEARAILDLFDGEISIFEKEGEKGRGKYLKINKMSNQRYLEDELPLRREEPEVKPPGSTTGQAVLDTRRIAVLPFVSMSPDPNDEYFADGLTEELITRISLVRGLEVIARTSAMNYKKKEKNASQIGRELKVGTLLEGSVRKAGNRIRVSAQLINANTEGHLWADSYDRDLQDIFEVQSSVAENVAGALKLRLLDEDRERVGSTADMEAYTMYLRGTQLLRETSPASCREAIAFLERATLKDPRFARAYAQLALAWVRARWQENWANCVTRAEAAARKALELGPESAEAHTAMAAVHGMLDRFEDMHLEAETAIEINPNLADASLQLGSFYASFGRFDEAIRYYRKALSLDPLASEPALELTEILRVAGRVDEALGVVDELREVHRRDPEWVYYQSANCYLQKKDYVKALDVLGTGLISCPDNPWLVMARGMAYALSGKRTEALDELGDLMKNEAESLRLTSQVTIRTALGDLDEAFAALMRQAELHSENTWIRYDPLYEGLRKDPRFSEFCKKVGLPI